MPRDGGGTYTLPAGNPVIPGTIIDTTWANPTMDDIAAALTDSLSRTGSGGMIVPFLNADGVVNLPGISWANQQNMGIYRPGLDEMRISVAANDKARWTSSATDPMDFFIGGQWIPVMHEAGDYSPSGVWDFVGVGPVTLTPSGALGALAIVSDDPKLLIQETGLGADLGNWILRANSGGIILSTASDAAPATPLDFAWSVTRGVGTAVEKFNVMVPTFLEERTAAISSLAGWGQLWVKDDAPNVLVFTDDLGTDFILGSISNLEAVTTVGNVTDNGILFTSPIADAQLLIDVDNGGPVNIVADTDVEIIAAGTMLLKVDAPDSFSFNVGNNNAMSIQDNIVRVNTDSGGYFEVRDDIGSNMRITMSTSGPSYDYNAIVGGDPDGVFYQDPGSGGLAMMYAERSAARASAAGFGQLWVKDDGPNVLMFTDDVGTDFILGGGGGGEPGRFGALAFRNTSQSITNNVLNAIQLNDTLYDTDSVWSGGDPTKLTVPAGVTKVRLGAGAIFVSSVSGQRKIEIRKNGSSTVFDASGLRPPMTVGGNAGVGGFFGQQVHSGSVDVVATDYFQAFVLQSSGGNLDLVANGSWMEMEILD